MLEAISKLGFLPEIKASPSLNPQAYIKYVEDLRRGLNAACPVEARRAKPEVRWKDFFEMASIQYA